MNNPSWFQPLFKRSIKPGIEVTAPVGYVRLHGRNYKQWFSAKANVRERYDYLYSLEELEPWVERIKAVSTKAEDTYVASNNHNLGKAVTNALEITLARPAGARPTAAARALSQACGSLRQSRTTRLTRWQSLEIARYYRGGALGNRTGLSVFSLEGLRPNCAQRLNGTGIAKEA